jgi:hypothetical protein
MKKLKDFFSHVWHYFKIHPTEGVSGIIALLIALVVTSTLYNFGHTNQITSSSIASVWAVYFVYTFVLLKDIFKFDKYVRMNQAFLGRETILYKYTVRMELDPSRPTTVTEEGQPMYAYVYKGEERFTHNFSLECSIEAKTKNEAIEQGWTVFAGTENIKELFVRKMFTHKPTADIKLIANDK